MQRRRRGQEHRASSPRRAATSMSPEHEQQVRAKFVEEAEHALQLLRQDGRPVPPPGVHGLLAEHLEHAAAWVAQYGAEFEATLTAKHAGDPAWGFLSTEPRWAAAAQHYAEMKAFAAHRLHRQLAEPAAAAAPERTERVEAPPDHGDAAAVTNASASSPPSESGTVSMRDRVFGWGPYSPSTAHSSTSQQGAAAAAAQRALLEVSGDPPAVGTPVRTSVQIASPRAVSAHQEVAAAPPMADEMWEALKARSGAGARAREQAGRQASSPSKGGGAAPRA
eukprot:COSAG01_NODE_4225_length_5225_cov_8.859930_2_plen_279_part_00